MKYQERDKLSLKITTGDGKEFTPHYRNPSIETDMNEASMQFSYLRGAFVPRGEVGGRVFPIELIFQGDYHLDEAKEFFDSAIDTRNWTMEHPYYGKIIGTPSKLKQDNVSLNVTFITFDYYETIEIKLVTGINLSLKAKNNFEGNYSGLADYDVKLDTSGVATVGEINTKNNANLKSKASSALDLKNISAKIAKADSAIKSIGTNSARYMSALTKVLQAPSQFYATVNSRIDMLESTYTTMVNTAKSLPTLGVKIFTEVAGAITLTAMCEASLTTMKDIAETQGSELYTGSGSDNYKVKDSKLYENEYTTKAQVYAVINRLIAISERYIQDLNFLQSEIENQLDSYYPDETIIRDLKTTIYLTIQNLAEIANKAKQERVFLLPKAMGLFELCGNLYGNVNEDTIDNFVAANNFTKNELLLIPQDREVVYYV